MSRENRNFHLRLFVKAGAGRYTARSDQIVNIHSKLSLVSFGDKDIPR
jgi:hypothetical protein